METTSPRYVRIRLSTLILALGLPLATWGTMAALAQDRGNTSGSKEQDTANTEYRIISPSGFRSLDQAERFLNQEGKEGWIFPDGCSIQKDEEGSFRVISPGEGRSRSIIVRRRVR